MSRNNINKFKPGSLNLFALCSVAFLCFLTACRDDTFDSFYEADENSPYINFKVTASSPGAEALSRGADDPYPGVIRNIYPLVSEEGGDTIYLIESEINGAYPVASPSASTQQSRGTMIHDTDGLVDPKGLGLYCFPSPEEGVGKPGRDTELIFDHWALRKKGPNDTSFHLINEEGENRDYKEIWPDYALDFLAYYPYTDAFKYTGAKYSDADKQDADYRDNLYGWVWTANRTRLCMHPVPRNDMYLYYKVPEKLDHQVDLMADYIQNLTHKTCNINLKHLLTAVRFQTGPALAPCTIKKIAISGVRGSGYMDASKLLDDGCEQLWETPEKDTTETGTGTGTETEIETGTETETETGTGNDFIDYLDLKKTFSKRATYTVDYGDKGREFKADPNNPDGYTAAGKSLLGDESQADNKNLAFFLMPQELEESAALYLEIEYEGQTIKDDGIEKKYILKKNLNLKPKDETKTWKPGTTITYTLSGSRPDLMADLYLTDENGMPLNEIRVGYIGGESNYKVSSYIYYKSEISEKKDITKNDITKLPMPWKASIVAVDEAGTETPIIWDDFKIKLSKTERYPGINMNQFKIGGIITQYNNETEGYENGIKNHKDTNAFIDNFGDIERIDYELYNENFPSGPIVANHVKTVVTIPKIKMNKTSSATAYMRGLEEIGSPDAPYNLAGRGIGLLKNDANNKRLEIFNKNKSQATEQLEREYENTDEYYGTKDVNTANCYIVSAPGWYSIPLVYGNAIKDGYVNYGAYVFKPKKNGESFTNKSDSLKDNNQILRYAIRHDGQRIYSPYILDPIGTVVVKGKEEPALVLPGSYLIDPKNVEAKLLWEDQICLIEDVTLVDSTYLAPPIVNQTLTMFKSNGNAEASTITYKPQKMIRFHIRKANIRQGNAVIVLKEKDTIDANGNVTKGDVIWSWHIWVTPDGTGTVSNYHPVSHKSTIYGAYYQHGHGTDSDPYYHAQDVWTEIHNHYIYNRCIGLVMAGDKYDFTPPKNIYIKYEPMYDALEARLSNNNGDLYQKIYGTKSAAAYVAKVKSEVGPFIEKLKKYYGVVGNPDYPGTNPVYVKVNQADLSCEIKEDYYMLYQWGRKDPMISRYENVYDGNHLRIDPTDKRYLAEHQDISNHKEWITYGIKHPDEFMWGGGIGSGTYYANLWDFSLGTDEINCMFPPNNAITNFFEDDTGISQTSVTQKFYYGSDRAFKSVYDPSPVGQKIPIGTVLNLLITNDKKVTEDNGQYTLYKYDFTTYGEFGHTAPGKGGLFTLEYLKDIDGNHLPPTEPHTFWIPAFGYRYGNGITTNHGNEFVIWEGGALNREGKGHVLFGNYSHVDVYGEAISKYNYAMGLPVLPIFDEPQWIRTW